MRAFAWFLGAILLAGCSAQRSPIPAYELTSIFAVLAFHRVASRIAMLVLVAALVWLCRHLHLTTRRDFGYGLPWRRFLDSKPAVGSGRHGHGRAWAPRSCCSRTCASRIQDSLPPRSSFARIFLVGVGSGISVALIEETVFRGVMHTAIERESGPWAAALLTAPLFAVLHFFAKVRIPRRGHRLGQRLRSYCCCSFAPLGHPALVLDSFLSWLAVGLILSLTRVLTGNIAVAIGLHAGWVVVLRMLQESHRQRQLRRPTPPGWAASTAAWAIGCCPGASPSPPLCGSPLGVGPLRPRN